MTVAAQKNRKIIIERKYVGSVGASVKTNKQTKTVPTKSHLIRRPLLPRGHFRKLDFTDEKKRDERMRSVLRKVQPSQDMGVQRIAGSSARSCPAQAFL